MGKTWTRDSSSQSVEAKKTAAFVPKKNVPIFKKKANTWSRETALQQSQVLNGNGNGSAHMTGGDALAQQSQKAANPVLMRPHSENKIAADSSETEAAARRRRLIAQGRLPRDAPVQIPQNFHSEGRTEAGRSNHFTPDASERPYRPGHTTLPIRNGNSVAHARFSAAPDISAQRDLAPDIPQSTSRSPAVEASVPDGADSRASKPANQNPGSAVDEIELMKRRIAETEANLAAFKEDERRRREQEALKERQMQEEQTRRKARLKADLAEAFQLSEEIVAEPTAQKHPAADRTEVARVLAARSDFDVMRLHAGASRLLVKKTYRSMTMALHPDKCKVDGATDAFQRLVTAYQGVLKTAR